MNDQILRSKLIRLASEKPELRQHLLPLLKKASESLEDRLHDFEMELASWIKPTDAKKIVDAVRQDLMPDNDQVQASIVTHAMKILKWKQNDKDMDELLQIWDEA
jgi:hypothetical protein